MASGSRSQREGGGGGGGKSCDTGNLWRGILNGCWSVLCVFCVADQLPLENGAFFEDRVRGFQDLRQNVVRMLRLLSSMSILLYRGIVLCEGERND